MHNEKIQITRVKRLLDRQTAQLYQNKIPLEAEFSYPDGEYKPLSIGGEWGKPWQTGFFRIRGKVPADWGGRHYGLFFDCDGEACLLENGSPRQGLTPKVDWYHKAAKHYVPLEGKYPPEAEFELMVDASANDLFGAGKTQYCLRECSLATFDEELFQRLMDIGLLLNLAVALPEGTVRRRRILYSLDKVCDNWATDQAQVQALLAELLSHPAHSSALTAYSVGHAHLDLAWLWPLRETRRKGGRTFANALRLMEQYPQYVFGASQAQLYQWIKEDYPALYEEVKHQVKTGRWEIQGATWVEFDTNLISAESIIRQFMYGKRFFLKEFGYVPRVLWLPDCFGFSGNLPQLLKGCGVDWFVTQKLSWNESNTFPHHLCLWEGIDGTRVMAHQLPTNDYNFSNDPSAFLETEKRYAQSELCDAFLNMYGIGDGGGGPTRNHLEYGLRMQDLEGVSKFRFCGSKDFFEHLEDLDKETLPVVPGELYLEYHRGTYTTQAKMKENNHHSENLLGVAEFWAVLAGIREYPDILRQAWQDTLFLQFHDILPGSSITPVYEDAAAISASIHERLAGFFRETAVNLGEGEDQEQPHTILVINGCNQEQDEWCQALDSDLGICASDEKGNELPMVRNGDTTIFRVRVPAWGYRQIRFTTKQAGQPLEQRPVSNTLENGYLRVEISSRGSITSIFDKEAGCEVLAGESNLLKLWEDEPNNWGAWDINHFYRSTAPLILESGHTDPTLSYRLDGQYSRIVQEIRIGESALRQTIELRDNERFIRIHHDIDWKERHRMLRAHFLPSVFSGIATYGIQNGVIQRSTKPKNAWEEAQFEVPAQRFVDLSQPDRGCALLCDVKFGYRVRDNEMEINLLRSPADVDPQADMHRHSYSYAFYPHSGDYAHSDVFSIAERLAHNPIVIPVAGNVKPIPEPPFHLISGNVNLDTVKPAEDGSGIVLRFHEFKGQNGTAELICARHYDSVRECDMLEYPLGSDSRRLESGESLRLIFRPFETKTLLFKEEP
jgi:alpha-mannosidase